MNTPNNPLRPKRNCPRMALMIIHDWPTVAPLESELMKHGYQVLRAQHAMHGYWLAMNASPSLIVTDLHEVESGGDNVLKYLQGSEKTCTIPVVYLSDRASEVLENRLRSRGITRCLPTKIAPFRFASEITQLLLVSMQEATKVDAVFSELGSELPDGSGVGSATPSTGWLPHRFDRNASPEFAPKGPTHEARNHALRGSHLGQLQQD